MAVPSVTATSSAFAAQPTRALANSALDIDLDSRASASASPATDVFVGKQRYRVRAKLSDTLYGGVWLADDTQSRGIHTTVAIKQVVLQTAQHALANITRCIDNPWDERQTLLQLAQLGPHANILQVHADFVEHGAWCVVMEYCDGGDLLQTLQQAPRHRLPEARSLALFAQIAQGVRFLHANGIAHRDLSLENVLLRDGVCKLCDFGLSTETSRVCAERVGKAYYMAPEVVACQPYDPAAADMWSLGIMLFILLTGSPLVPSASKDEKAFRALEQFGVRVVLQVWGMDHDFSSDVLDLLDALLQPDVALRCSIDDVVAHPALQHAL